MATQADIPLLLVSRAELKSVVSEAVAEGLLHAPKAEKPAEYLSREEVAHLLGVSKQSIYVWTREGTLPAQRIGGKVLYKRSDVEAVLAGKPIRSRKPETRL